MAQVPSTAKCVVIGAGIVGNSLVHHLAKLGWRDLVLLDQGPLPNPGGSTGWHSHPGPAFIVNLSVDVDSLDIMRLARETGALYLDTCILPWPDEDHLVLWHAQTLLREFRGELSAMRCRLASLHKEESK